MYCMKCGRETQEDRSFCEDCLLDMERYPVRPGTVVQIPQRRQQSTQRKAPRRKAVPLEDQVKTLRKRLRIVSACLLAALILIAVLVYPAVQHMMGDHFAIGQNYSSAVDGK